VLSTKPHKTLQALSMCAAVVGRQLVYIGHGHCPGADTPEFLYGRMNQSGKYREGVFTAALRRAVRTEIPTWIVLDGPMNAATMEPLNTLLDDNRVFCLPTGERVRLTPNVRIIFLMDPESVSQLSPATVSRLGKVSLLEELPDSLSQDKGRIGAQHLEEQKQDCGRGRKRDSEHDCEDDNTEASKRPKLERNLSSISNISVGFLDLFGGTTSDAGDTTSCKSSGEAASCGPSKDSSDKGLCDSPEISIGDLRSLFTSSNVANTAEAEGSAPQASLGEGSSKPQIPVLQSCPSQQLLLQYCDDLEPAFHQDLDVRVQGLVHTKGPYNVVPPIPSEPVTSQLDMYLNMKKSAHSDSCQTESAPIDYVGKHIILVAGKYKGSLGFVERKTPKKYRVWVENVPYPLEFFPNSFRLLR